MKFVKIAAVAWAVLTLIITIVFFTWWAFKEEAVFGNEKFDQTKWVQLASYTDQECKRGDMAYDLKSRILFRGAKKQAVMALLGRPSIEDGQAIEYDLGRCMLVYHALRIYFDADDKLTHSTISSH